MFFYLQEVLSLKMFFNKNSMITIFTPTYNRAYIIGKLYQSLCKQTCQDFEWLILDDGSTDNTESIIKSYNEENKIVIRYHKQENGGKHTAINKAMNLAEGELFFIVDSDDLLADDAVETIIDDWEKVKGEGLCGISYLRGYADGKVIGHSFPKERSVDNFIELRVNKGVSGDKAEVWETNKLRQYKFPIFPGEKFIGEGYLWYQLGLRYDMLFVNKVIYICEYLDDGLTKSGKKMRIQNPLGGIATSLMQMNPRSRFTYRLKKGLLYGVYSFFANRSIKDMMGCKYKSFIIPCIPFGWILYKFWQKKYLPQIRNL